VIFLAEEKTNEQKIEELNEQLYAELTVWEELGIQDPNAVINFNPMQMSMWLKSLTKFLSEKGIIEESEFILSFKQHMLKELIRVREEQVEPEVRKMKLKDSGIVLPGGMAVPKGNVRKIH
jgi:hypothetical protein